MSKTTPASNLKSRLTILLLPVNQQADQDRTMWWLSPEIRAKATAYNTELAALQPDVQTLQARWNSYQLGKKSKLEHPAYPQLLDLQKALQRLTAKRKAIVEAIVAAITLERDRCGKVKDAQSQAFGPNGTSLQVHYSILQGVGALLQVNGGIANECRIIDDPDKLIQYYMSNGEAAAM